MPPGLRKEGIFRVQKLGRDVDDRMKEYQRDGLDTVGDGIGLLRLWMQFV